MKQVASLNLHLYMHYRAYRTEILSRMHRAMPRKAGIPPNIVHPPVATLYGDQWANTSVTVIPPCIQAPILKMSFEMRLPVLMRMVLEKFMKIGRCACVSLKPYLCVHVGCVHLYVVPLSSVAIIILRILCAKRFFCRFEVELPPCYVVYYLSYSYSLRELLTTMGDRFTDAEVCPL